MEVEKLSLSGDILRLVDKNMSSVPNFFGVFMPDNCYNKCVFQQKIMAKEKKGDA